MKTKIAAMIIRFLLTAVLLVLVYRETGWATVVAMTLFMLEVELRHLKDYILKWGERQ